MKRWGWLIVGVLVVSGCKSEPQWKWNLPSHFPEPNVPIDNPMSAAKVELGRFLFYDTKLSNNQTMSCGSICHRQETGFASNRRGAVGSTGEHHRRNSMGLTNIAYASRLTWAHPLTDSLETQLLVPLFGEDPIELGMPSEDVLLKRLQADARYPKLFKKAFPKEDTAISTKNMAKAIAAFERTFLSVNSPYDKFLQGKTDALSASAHRGMTLFFSERLECFHCHGGFNFSNSVNHVGLVDAERAFHNTGLYNEDGKGAYPKDDRGLLELTEQARDMGKFKAPTLRNISVTAPYMHDGSLPTLSHVLDHYAAGGRAESPLTDAFIPGFILSETEKADVLAFLESLTDPSFLTDPRFSNPH